MLGQNTLGTLFANDINEKDLGYDFLTNLFEGIYNKYFDSTIEMTGGLHFYTAPKNTEMEYGVYFLVTDVPEYTFTESSENVIVQFSIFGKNELNLLSIISQFKKLFDWAELTIDNYYNIYCRRIMSEMFPYGDTFQGVLQFRILAEVVA